MPRRHGGPVLLHRYNLASCTVVALPFCSSLKAGLFPLHAHGACRGSPCQCTDYPDRQARSELATHAQLPVTLMPDSGMEATYGDVDFAL